MDGPTADLCEKGGRAVATYPNFTPRDEVQRYLEGCEELLAAASGPQPFTIEEMALIQYYLDEVGKISSVSTRTRT
jgi:hypothetical protein